MTTEKSLGIAARIWCDPRTQDIEMDPVLAEVFAERVDRLSSALQAALEGVAGWRDSAREVLHDL